MANITPQIIGPGGTLTLSANPDNLNFGDVQVTSVTQQVFQLQNTTPGAGQDTTITIINTVVDNPAFVVTGVPASLTFGTFAIVTVTFTAPSTLGTVNGTINISSTSDNTPTLVTLTANVVAAATSAISVSPSSFTFPATKVGQQSAPMTFTITNTSTISVTVHPPTATPHFFMVSPPTADTVLAPGASMTVQVLFNPSLGGLEKESSGLIVTSTASTSPNNVLLKGTGILITPYGYVIGGLENGFATIGNLMRQFNATDFNCEEQTLARKLLSFYGPGQESRMLRIEIQYEDVGPSSVTLSAINEHGEISQQAASIGSTTAGHLVRNQLWDLFISGELINVTFNPFGPLVMVAYIPMFNEAGDTKKVKA